MRKVEGEGPKDAKIMVIGEAPGETEEKEGRPFCGQAGRVLDGILEEAGIIRSSLYITNTYKYKPKNNVFTTIPKEELARAYEELREEVSLVKPNLLVLLGNEPMKAVLGYPGVANYRGSILESKLGKCLPTYHPAAISREWKFRPLSVVDWEKVKVEGEFSEVRRTRRDLLVKPSYNVIDAFLTDIYNAKKKVAFDIEVETAQITCISFAASPVQSLCIPFWFGASGSFWSIEEELKIWQKIKSILEDPKIPKIAQNAQYDMTILRDIYGISVKGLWLDTMLAFHSIYPELPKGLDLLCSLYTDVPYYKFLRTTKDMDKFFEYNALDSCVTYECAIKIYKEMEEFGVRDFYYEYVHSLLEPLMVMARRGVKIDLEKKKELVKNFTSVQTSLQEKIDSSVGHSLNINSPKQMKQWLYEEMKFPVKYKLRKGKGEKTVAADEEALRSLYEESKVEALKLILELREAKKLLSTYLITNYDKEKCVSGTGEEVWQERAKTSYHITGTETGRLSSRETVYHTGTNLQNIPKGVIRGMFIPDEGKVFINADLSQAEARVVAWLAGEERLIQVFNLGGDIHKKNASNIFRKKEEEVTKDERELAKRLVHASNYLIGPVTFGKSLGISLGEAKRLLNAYFSEYPRIKIWHMGIQSKLRKSRVLTTPFGRKRTFFNRFDNSLLREAVAYVPQSTVAEVLNLGLRKLYENIVSGTGEELGLELLLQNHDAVLCQVNKDKLMEGARIVKDCLSIEFFINNKPILIPVDVSTGSSWENLEKIKV